MVTFSNSVKARPALGALIILVIVCQLSFLDAADEVIWKNPGKGGARGAWGKVSLADNQTGATNILPADVNGDGKTDWLASRGHGKGE